MKAVRIFTTLAVALVCLCTVVIGQKNASQPQPKADALPPVGVATPNRGAMVVKPEATMPIAPAGFTVSVFAELQAPRTMVYAPNGDLFVASPAGNNITVFRDSNND